MDQRLVFRVHAIQRMFERGITEEDVRSVLETGQDIEYYPNDSPYPSRLLLGWRGMRPVHIVVADNHEENEVLIITVYEPDKALWEPDFRRRKP
jgi:hypothetical protein